MNKTIHEMHADICKALAHPKRLRILEALGQKPHTVAELARLLKVPSANVSQHLALLRQKHLVVTARSAQSISYRLANPKVTRACRLMREVLLSQIRDSQTIFKKG